MVGWRPEYPRTVPERRPPGHQPLAPRWTAEYEAALPALTCDYLAIQVASLDDPAVAEFRELVQESTAPDAVGRPAAAELLVSHDEAGFVDVVHLGYWTDPGQHARWVERGPVGRWFRGLEPTGVGFGAWHEVVAAPLERVETIYSSPKHEFGFAACPGIAIRPMTTNGYFGAARDRFPIAAIDALDAPAPHVRRTAPAPSRGARLRASLGLNTVVIRSGQYWEDATGEQLVDYVEELEPKLLRGMSHLRDHREATGTISLRILRNLERADLAPRRETSTLAYFHSLGDLEEWARSHATHTAIYQHAIAKNREYGDERTVVTWHEVFVLPESATYEYVNCHPATGVLDFAQGLWGVIDA